MSRDEYVAMRNSNSFNIRLLYDHFVKNNEMGFDFFSRYIEFYLHVYSDVLMQSMVIEFEVIKIEYNNQLIKVT